jgi:molybdate transport system substrate-binding protein
MINGKRLVALVAVVLAMLSGAPARAQESGVVVFAAASLKNALDAAAAAWREATGGTTSISYAGSSALAQQIEQGAPAGLFISANAEWMDYLAERGLIVAESRIDLLGNRLVLVAPADSGIAVDIAPGFDLAGALGDGHLAMANTDAVPAGIYGKQALTALGVWESVAPRVAQAQDVRAALALVALGEAPLGIVYATDAGAEPGVRIVAAFPEETHDRIIYPAALVAGAENEAARSLLDFLRSDAAAPFFEAEGFALLAE